MLSACARFACAVWSTFWALVGSSFATTCPTFTFCPTATSTAVSVPLVPNPTEAELATPTLPDALTLDWTIPRLTVAVRCALALEAGVLRKP